MLNRFLEGLKSKNEETRIKTVKELKKYVSRELPDMNVDEVGAFINDFSKNINDMVYSSEIHERKSGISAIIVIVSSSHLPNKIETTSRYVNYLKNQGTTTDTELMELIAHAIGKVARVLTIETTDPFVEHEVTRSLENLSPEKGDSKKYAALLTLKELAIETPASFYKLSDHLFEQIFPAIRDRNPLNRMAAIGALRAALNVVATRETKENERDLKENVSHWSLCLTNALTSFEIDPTGREKRDQRDDKLHGSLMMINELFRCCGLEGEARRQEVEESLDTFTTESNTSTSRLEFLKNLVRGMNPLSHHPLQFSTSGHGLKTLNDVVRHHHELGLVPGGGSLSKREKPVQSVICRKVLSEDGSYERVMDAVMHLRNREGRSIAVQQAFLTLVPRIAAFNPKVFSNAHLNKDSTLFPYLIRKTREDKFRAQAFACIGLLTLAVRERMNPFLREPHVTNGVVVQQHGVFFTIREHLSGSNNRRRIPPDPAIFICISLIAEALGTSVRDEIQGLLQPMFETGLSLSLTSALRRLSIEIPQLKKEIQEGMLKMLEKVLNSTENPTDSKSTILALEVLGRLDFKGRSLMKFLKICSDNYISCVKRKSSSKQSKRVAI